MKGRVILALLGLLVAAACLAKGPPPKDPNQLRLRLVDDATPPPSLVLERGKPTQEWLARNAKHGGGLRLWQPQWLTIYGYDGQKMVELNLATGHATLHGSPNEAARAFWRAVEGVGVENVTRDLRVKESQIQSFMDLAKKQSEFIQNGCRPTEGPY